MNSHNFECLPDHKYPEIELDMTNFMEHLSDKYIYGKTEINNDSIPTNPSIIACKTEDLGEITSVSGTELEQEEKVRNFDINFVLLYPERL